LPDPEVLTLLKEGSQALEIERRSFTDAEVLDRLLLPMINEGARILEEGVAMRSSDIDAVWIHGYGWPAYRGGPLRHADTLGLDRVLEGMRSLQSAYGDRFAPSKLLEQLAVEGRRFADLPARTQRAAAFSDNGQGV
jgi:3-hydroxyacyl-CoA dehydrogenase